MRQLGLLAVLLTLAAPARADDLSQLRFLLGEWTAVDSAAGESGRFAFTLAVQDHVMLRANEATYAATSQRPASRHDDLMVIYPDGGSLKADYFDNEGHVIHYAVQPRGADAVVFVSGAKTSEPRYRLSYSMGADGVLEGTFEIAPPGSASAFKPYLSWKARRK